MRVDDTLEVEELSRDFQRVSLRMIDISVSGAAVLASHPLGEIDEEVVIVVRRAGDPQRIVLPCLIRYVLGKRLEYVYGDQDWLHGARFRDLSAPAWRFVNACVAAHSAGEAG